MRSISIILSTLATLLMAAVAARYVTNLWLFGTFASLHIHIAALAFGLCVLSFLIHRRWLNGLLAIAALALGAHGFFMLGEFRQPVPLDYGNTPTFKLISINIEGNNDANHKRIADYIIGSGADVVFIQESAPIGPDIPRIKAVYPYRVGCGAQTITCDSSIWSKLPLITGKAITASPIYRDRLMIASIELNGHVINFANVHLTKPYFDNFQDIELGKITEALAAVQGPSVLTRANRRFLRDSKLMTFDPEPNTIPVEATPVGLAIDHVFVRDPLRITKLVRAPDPLGSNHFGLIADIVFQDPAVTYPPR